MRKIVAQNFEIELSSKQLSDTEENNWFSDDMRLQFTFPFEVTIDDDLDSRLGMITLHNTVVKTVYPVTYTHYDKIAQGELEILEINDRKASMELVTGMEQLPSWDKKLSELSLAVINLAPGVSIYDHANATITETWPDVYYNFPQIHTNHKETDQEDMQQFLGRINNRDANTGNFYDNTVDVISGIVYNRNVMQPLCYWLYILQKIAEDAGLTLSGDILQDTLIQRILVHSNKQYYDKANIAPISADLLWGETLPTLIADYRVGVKNIFITTPGLYRLVANARTKSDFFGAPTLVRVEFNGVILLNHWNYDFFHQQDIDILLPCDGVSNNIRITVATFYPEIEQIVAGVVETVALFTSGGAVPTVQNKPIVNLKRAVPDVTAGDFMKITKNWFNYDWDVVGNELVMNKVQTKLNEQEYFDLSGFKTKLVPRKFNQGYSFLLSFGDIDSEYNYQKVYHSKSLIATDNYKTNEKTNEIQIDALPYPNALKQGVFTADAFQDSDNKVYVVLYDGLTNGNNYTQNHIELLLPNIHELYWRDWLNFRINAQTYTLIFNTFYEKIQGLKSKIKCYAYNKYFIPSRIERKEIKPDLFEINVEIYSIEAP